MTTTEIRKYRLINHQLLRTRFKTAKDIVKWLGAVQAQDYEMAKWAIGVRLPNSTDAAIEREINKGTIIRTHILRPTWHFVSSDDIRWMLDLTAPHVNSAAAFMYRKLELNNKIFNRSNAIIEKSLEGGKQLTRRELMAELNSLEK